jgi:hypothetical protein
VVGVIETLEWEGRAGDPLEINMYVSQENATQLKRLQQSTLTTTKVSALDYSILDYDPETKQWFTQSAPEKQRLSGIVAGKENPELNVDLTPVPAKAGINLNVFKVSVQIAPGQNQACPHICQQRHHASDETRGPGDRGQRVLLAAPPCWGQRLHCDVLYWAAC